MDVHKDTVMVAVLPEGAPAPTVVKELPNDERRVRRFFDHLSDDGEVWACYEASGAGYVLQRALTAWGHHCDVVAPSGTPRRPGERRKHDKRDATELARLYRAGELVVIRIPEAAEERVRDLVRCRETFQREILKSRHYLRSLLARRGFVYRAGSHWTLGHFGWIRRLLVERALTGEDQHVVEEYLALTPAYRDAVARLRSFRGLDTQAAMVLATEIGDWRRLQRPTQLMAYLGLVPSEHSSGERERKKRRARGTNRRMLAYADMEGWVE